jgi:hypothetical protein
MGQGDAQKPEGVGCVGIPVDACGSCAEEDQRERAYEFGGEALGKIVHGEIVREAFRDGDRTIVGVGEGVKNF